MAGVNEKLLDLANSFKQFNFPNGTVQNGDARQTAYITAVSNLYCLNTMKLDSIVGEYLEELQLAIDFEIHDGAGNDGKFLSEFTAKLQVAVEEENKLLEDEFTASQVAFSQSDSEFEGSLTGSVRLTLVNGTRMLASGLSFSSTANGSQPEFDQFDDPLDLSVFESPSASMSRLELRSPTSPAKRRRLSGPKKDHAPTFLERLAAETPAPSPHLPSTSISNPSYEFGVLPFAIDWEIWRVALYTSLELHQFRDILPTLQVNIGNPSLLWSSLRTHVESIKATAVRQDFILEGGFKAVPEPLIWHMPPLSSGTVWETLQTKGWDNGEIHYSLKFDCKPNGTHCRVVPQAIQISKSRRVYRKFGGDRFVSVSVPQAMVYNRQKAIIEFLLKPLSICGRIFRAFFVKRSPGPSGVTVHYFATHGSGLESKDVNLNQLLEWVLSLNSNRKAAASKLWDRISLSLSSTTPTIIFGADQIRLVPDIKSSSNEDMTDGCAKASPAVFREIWRSGVLGSKETPTAVQGRIGGAKGVWYVDPLANPHSDEMWIEIRPSQLKYMYDPVTFEDEKLRTLDVLKVSNCKSGSTLNNQFIGILSHCGVPDNVFQSLLEDDLKRTLDLVNDYLDKPNLLRYWVATAGRIYDIRCMGTDNTDISGEEAAQEPRCITYNEAGVPTMAHEVCVSLLEAGFLPKSSRILREKLKHVLSKACEKLSEHNKMHIYLGKSTAMTCIADDLGILEENQVSIRFGKPLLDEDTGRSVPYIDGDVLVARNPALLPCDIQKLRAVDAPQLHHLTDVIVFSTKGLQSPVSSLSGGDYDGDTIWICWDERLVKTFQPANVSFSKEPPGFLEQYFKQDKRSVEEITGAVDGEPIDPEKFINYGLSISFLESELGTCTDRHRDVVYARRYDDPSAITLARLASRLVDAPKQGLRLRRDKWTDILRGLKVSVPNYIEPKGVRTPRNTSHIMDILVLEIIPEYQSRVLKSFNDNAGSDDLPIDSDIRGFYEKVKEKYPALVETLRNSLANLEKEWITFITKSKATQDKNREFITCSPTKKGQKKSSSRISQSELEEFYAEYASIPVDGLLPSTIYDLSYFGTETVSFVDKIKAATAYCLKLETNNRWMPNEPSHFVWSCGGFRALCEIKANAVMARSPKNLPPRILTEEMYISLKASASFYRAEKLKYIGIEDINE